MTTTLPERRAGGSDTGVHSLGRLDWSTWPRYEAAVLGFRNYWYPVTWSRKVTPRPIAVTVLGEKMALVRDQGRVRARAFGDVEVRTYPVEERVGVVWVYVGDGPPPPVEDDMPEGLTEPDAVVCARITSRPGNWRFGAENGFDEGHAKYLHRKSLWAWRTELPVWAKIRVEATGRGWITRITEAVRWGEQYPGLGTWPPYKAPWRKRGKRAPVVSIRLPGALRVAYRGWDHYEWWFPIDGESHIYVQVAATNARGLKALAFRARYRTYVRWIFHGLFNDEDRLMVDVMDAPPERLYRPDKAIIAWRELCESPRGESPLGESPRGAPGEPTVPPDPAAPPAPG